MIIDLKKVLMQRYRSRSEIRWCATNYDDKSL